MRVGLITDAPERAKALGALLERVHQPIHVVPVEVDDAYPPCALLVVDSDVATRVSVERLARAPCTRWGIGVQTTALPVHLHLSWDAGLASLQAALGAVRAQVRARAGIAAEDLLTAGMRRIVELASESIEVTDSTVRLLYVNPAFERITGWALEDAVGHSTSELFRAGSHDPSYYAEIMRTLRSTGTWQGPLIGRRRDGTLSFQQATLAAIPDTDGRPRGFIAIKQDAERDALANQAMESSGRRLQTMLEEAADAFFVHDDEGVLADVNATACKLLDTTRDALLGGTRLQDLLEEPEEERIAGLVRSVRVGEPVTLDALARRADGTTVAVGLRLGAFLFGGERFVVTLARDISERVALEASLRQRSEELDASLQALHTTQRELFQREKLAALGSLVAGVAHEVNTPLGVTLTAITLARDLAQGVQQALTAPQPSRRAVIDGLDQLTRSLDLAVQNAQRAATLIADFKKVSVDRASEQAREVELLSYLETVVASLAPMLRSAAGRVEVSGTAVTLRTRPGAIAQVLTNLIQNAFTHAFENGEERMVLVRCRLEGTQAVVEVEDEGCGIPGHLLSRIFEPFVSTRLGRGGSGLGMHIVHNLVVEALQGDIELHSTLGEGTLVRIRLPIT